MQFLIFPDGILWDKQMNPQYRTLKCNDFFETVSRISSTYKNKTEGGNPSSVNLCGRRESNPYASRHQILSLACLPISTRPQQYFCLPFGKGLQMYDKLSYLQNNLSDNVLALREELQESGRHSAYDICDNSGQNHYERSSDLP